MPHSGLINLMHEIFLMAFYSFFIDSLSVLCIFYYMLVLHAIIRGVKPLNIYFAH